MLLAILLLLPIPMLVVKLVLDNQKRYRKIKHEAKAVKQILDFKGFNLVLEKHDGYATVHSV
ncbi:MAG TPA: hypothetical protein VK005_03020 [Acholeplasma sp.]|nr:hypothetical protein [Acholeplasma sp.]